MGRRISLGVCGRLVGGSLEGPSKETSREGAPGLKACVALTLAGPFCESAAAGGQNPSRGPRKKAENRGGVFSGFGVFPSRGMTGIFSVWPP